jgi:hypothetical protein
VLAEVNVPVTFLMRVALALSPTVIVTPLFILFASILLVVTPLIVCAPVKY